MLQELAVPGRVRLVAVTPVNDEFRQQGPGEVLVNVRQAQDIKDIGVRLPILGDAPGLGAVGHAGGVLGPLDSDVLDKLRVQFFRCRAALAPVKYELRYRLVDELPLHPAAQHDLQRVPAGPPVVVQFLVVINAEGLRLQLLLSAPAADHVLAVLVFPGVAGFAALAPIKDEILQLVEGELPGYVVVEGQQLQQVFAG